MKNIFTFLINLFFILGFYSCSNIEGMPTPYGLGFVIDIINIEPKVSVVKVSIKNIDNLKPEAYSIDPYSDDFDPNLYKRENYTFTRRKKENEDDKNKSSWSLGRDKHFPGYKYFELTYPLKDVDRVFELKIYKDDALFLTKKLTFRTGEKSYNNDIMLITTKAEVNNMDYVAQINLDSRMGRTIIIDLSKKNHK